MAKPKAATPQVEIVIRALQRAASSIILIGDSPLIVHAWSQKQKLVMLQKHMKSITIREAKDPVDDFLRSMYRLDDGAYGFPVVGIKEAMATATIDLEQIDKAKIYRNVMVTGKRGFQVAAFADLLTPHELAELFSSSPPAIREDMVKLSGIGRQPDIRYRAEFWPWAMRFNLAYMQDFITQDNLMNLLQRAGFCVGLGEWRQERGGSNGAFHVAASHEVKMVERWITNGQKEPAPIDARAWLSSLHTSAKADAKTVEVSAPVIAAKTRAKKSNGKAARQ